MALHHQQGALQVQQYKDLVLEFGELEQCHYNNLYKQEYTDGHNSGKGE